MQMGSPLLCTGHSDSTYHESGDCFRGLSAVFCYLFLGYAAVYALLATSFQSRIAAAPPEKNG
jgi:hypothetical protein